MFWILVSLALLAVLYFFAIKPFKYWNIRGVKQGSPLPIVGDSWGIVTKTQSFAEYMEQIYTMFPNSRYGGIYQFLIPTLVLRDPDLIKQITVKDFDHFLDHRSFVSPEADPLFGNNLFALKGQQWRDMRTTLSPAFTSSKMRQMFVLMTETGEQFVKYFHNKKDDVIVVELKDTFTRFTNDVIASAAFGIKCDSLDEPDNEFYMMGKEVTDFSGIRKNLRFFGYFLVPKLYTMFKIKMFSEEVGNFFYNLVVDNIARRIKNGIVRPDMINLLMEARKNGLKHDDNNKQDEDAGFATVQESEMGKAPSRKTEITDMDIASQALIFFFAGFDSVSNLMCFMAYELAVNPDIQDRLIQEVDQTSQECNGKLTYDALLQMKYMDMVTSESLRKWPNAVGVDRVCTKPYVIQPTRKDETPVYLNPGDVLFLPIFGIHRDPEYYPEPERFDPERFNDDNKHKINPYAYVPFGAGPRNCIGSRFALLETKALFFYILDQFEIVPVEKTAIPLKISKKQFNLTAEGGFWLGFKPRRK